MKKVFLLLACLASYTFADPVEPYSPLKPHAPVEVHADDKSDPAVTSSEAREIAGEFHGIVGLGYRASSFQGWPGRSMSDCHASAGPECGECELVTGHARTYFGFYGNSSVTGCTLQQMDVHFQISDSSALKELRKVVRDLFGNTGYRAEKPSSRETGWDGSGPGWKWEGDSDLAYLYMDQEQMTSNGAGTARFQWRRSPLFKPSK
jgi:hypothetical protein